MSVLPKFACKFIVIQVRIFVDLHGIGQNKMKIYMKRKKYSKMLKNWGPGWLSH